MKYVIIPSAKYSPSELGFKEVPMALFPINNESILDLIIDSYSSVDSFVISTFEGSRLINEYIGKYKNLNIKSVTLDRILNLGYTIYFTLKKINVSDTDIVVINFADTVIDNNNLSNNCIVFQNRSSIEDKWTYFITEDNLIKRIIDKKNQNNVIDNDCLYKLFCGLMVVDKPLSFLKCLEEAKNKKGYDFFAAVIRYSRIFPFDFIEANNWLDLGHIDEYFDSKMMIKSRNFNHISFDKNRGIIKKTSDDTTKFKGEIEWYLNLPKKLLYLSPRLFDYSLDENNMYVEMEYYSYPTVLELYLFGNLSIGEWTKVFEKIKFVIDDFRNYEIVGNNIKESLYEMYYTKTISRLDLLKNINEFKLFFSNSITINGKKFYSLSKIIKKLNEIVESNLLSMNSFCIIHGDLCFANILIDDKYNFVKLIDPRGSFGSFGIYGDQRYELAKLFHSVDGKYDCIIKDFFEINVDGTNIWLNVDCNRVGFDLYELLKKVFKDTIGDQLKNIEIIEALLFLSMIPLHSENKNHQYAMLATGIQILNRWINLEEKE